MRPNSLCGIARPRWPRVLLALALAGCATTAKPDGSPTDSPRPEFHAARLAAELAIWGRENADAAALAVAAKVADSVEVTTLAVAPERGDASDMSGAAGTPGESVAPDSTTLRDEARAFAGVDASWLEDVERSGVRDRGRLGGALRGARGNQLPPRWWDRWDISFQVGRPATVQVWADNCHANLDIYIYDSNGNLVARNNAVDTGPWLRWMARSPYPYRVVIQNYGPHASAYSLWTD